MDKSISKSIEAEIDKNEPTSDRPTIKLPKQF